MMANLDAHRAAFLYELPADGQPAAGGAVCAILMDVHQRFGPHVRAWRNASSHGGASGCARAQRAGAAARAMKGQLAKGKGGGKAKGSGKAKGKGGGGKGLGKEEAAAKAAAARA